MINDIAAEENSIRIEDVKERPTLGSGVAQLRGHCGFAISQVSL